MHLKDFIRDIPDFPKPGIQFRDITPLLNDTAAFRSVVDRLSEQYAGTGVDTVAGIESRGFLFAAPLAYRLGVALVPIRKEGKLPFETNRATYSLEYGTSALEIHTDATSRGRRVLVMDDLLATGDTMAAAVRLVEQIGGQVAGLAVVIELADLDGRSRLSGYEIYSMITY